MIDPTELAEKTKEIVCRGSNRKYYRFRAAPFYGGIATTDCAGCNLRCVFCWARNIIVAPEQKGKFYQPKEVAEKLLQIATNKAFPQLRISGNEPTIGKAHLLQVLEEIPPKLQFILETNGTLIDKDYAGALSKFSNLHVRVSLKGSNEEEFSKFTKAKPKAFQLQLNALKNLQGAGVSCHPAVISIVKDLNGLKERLAAINPKFASSLEKEELILYPAVKKRLEKEGITYS